MVVIPGINCPDFGCVKNHCEKALGLGATVVQIDVSDGVFAPVKSWNNPAELSALTHESKGMEAEIHLMVEDPSEVFESWIRAGAKKLVIHVESNGDLESIRKRAESLGVKIVWGIKTATPLETLDKYLEGKPDSAVQFLDVPPGFSGGVFNPAVLEKIKSLRAKWPEVEIRVDGGMNPETAKRVKDAGADAVVAVSYLWNGDSPKKAYQELIEIWKIGRVV